MCVKSAVITWLLCLVKPPPNSFAIQRPVPSSESHFHVLLCWAPFSGLVLHVKGYKYSLGLRDMELMFAMSFLWIMEVVSSSGSSCHGVLRIVRQNIHSFLHDRVCCNPSYCQPEWTLTWKHTNKRNGNDTLTLLLRHFWCTNTVSNVTSPLARLFSTFDSTPIQ